MPTVTPTETALMLGTSVATIYRKAKAGVLTNVGTGRVEFDTEHLDAATRHSMGVRAAAEAIGTTRASVYHLLRTGQLERWPLLVGEIRVSNESVQRYMSARQ